MNPFFLLLINPIFHLTRICPVCNRKQVIKPSQRKDPVVCKFCGGKIPVPDDQKR